MLPFFKKWRKFWRNDVPKIWNDIPFLKPKFHFWINQRWEFAEHTRVYIYILTLESREFYLANGISFEVIWPAYYIPRFIRKFNKCVLFRRVRFNNFVHYYVSWKVSFASPWKCKEWIVSNFMYNFRRNEIINVFYLKFHTYRNSCQIMKEISLPNEYIILLPCSVIYLH